MRTDIVAMMGHEISAGVRSGAFTALQVAETFLARIKLLNPEINAFTAVTGDRARTEAARVDKLIASGVDPGPLVGVPYSAKNLFDLKGLVTLAGSRINADNPAADRDATAVARLSAAGALCLGATNMGEYAYDFTTTNAHYGSTRNPLDRERSAGGSSGGSAAAISAGLCKLALGTDTNGSMRVPAAFCGVWGFKPGYRRLSRAGSFPFVSSLDTIGVFAQSVRDLALSFDAMSGADPSDPVCQKDGTTPVAPVLAQGEAAIRIARLGGYFTESLDAVVASAVERICSALGVTEVLELPTPELARSAAYLITASEGGQLHRDRLSTRSADFDPATRARFIAGYLAPSSWYLQAQRFRSLWRKQVTGLLNEVDVLIAPATPMPAPLLDAKLFNFRGQEVPLRPNIGLFTQPITLIGLPVLAVPVTKPGQLSAAVQLITRPGNELQLLQLAQKLEKSAVCVPNLFL